MIDLDAAHLKTIREIISTTMPDCEVRIFGSRVTGKASRYSDLDVALLGKENIEWSQLEKLKDAFSESDLPIKVDVHDWNALSDSFKQSIGSRYEVI